ncbi:MAG: hypothetical protein LBM20_08430, partial [Rikenellaceae bacterium]|nr:hypothetical protein [Rikenellaceae bacterium]
MMQAVDQELRKNRIYAAIAALIYGAVWVLLILFLHFQIMVTDNESEGLLINFGTTETGWGETDLSASDEMAQAPEASPSTSQQTPADVVQTQETEVAPAMPVNPTETPEPPVEQPRQVDQRALFPGRTVNSTSSSEGTTAGAGNQGNPAGSPTGSHTGTGTGDSGISYDLSGRSVIGTLPPPAYTVREEGRVIIEIYVDQQGRVTRTSFRSVGSTTTNATLVAAAERAARQA